MDRFSRSEITGCIVAIILSIAVIITLFYPPSKKHYNPSLNLHYCIDIASSDDAKEKWCADRSDLAAQWKTADLTNSAFWAGMLGIWLLGWTLIATRQAVKVTKNAAQAELRAYLAIDAVKGGIPSKKNAMEVSLIEFWVKNSGSTPAKILSIKHQWVELITKRGRELDPQMTAIKDKVIHCFENTEIDKVVISKDSKAIGFSPIPNTLNVTLARGDLSRVYLDIRIKYEDIYNRVWGGEYLLEFIKLGSPNVIHATESQIN